MKIDKKMPNGSDDLVGLIPAAGTASRLKRLPSSKEVFPVGFHKMRDGVAVQPKAVSHYLLEHMQLSGVKKSYIIVRKGKWDIPNYFCDGKMLNMHIAYLLMNLPYGVPFTIDQAYPFLKDATVVFGFPDILFESKDAFDLLLSRLKDSNADVVLGLYPTQEPHKADMVEVDANGRIQSIEIKPTSTALRYAWIMAVWKFTFTEFMHRFLEVYSEKDPPKDELFIGDVFQAAIQESMQIESIIFQNSRFQDIGSPEDLIKAIRQAEFS